MYLALHFFLHIFFFIEVCKYINSDQFIQYERNYTCEKHIFVLKNGNN